MDPEQLMQLAVEQARAGVAAGQSPFGCAIAREGRLVAAAHNRVVAQVDITAHAEVEALREACRAEDSILLTGAVVATTCEPCPMCMAALHWARVETVYFGAGIADAERAGFNELQISAVDMMRQGGGTVRLVPGVLAAECRQLFDDWLARPDRTSY